MRRLSEGTKGSVPWKVIQRERRDHPVEEYPRGGYPTGGYPGGGYPRGGYSNDSGRNKGKLTKFLQAVVGECAVIAALLDLVPVKTKLLFLDRETPEDGLGALTNLKGRASHLGKAMVKVGRRRVEWAGLGWVGSVWVVGICQSS